jgi:hypothetical protein
LSNGNEFEDEQFNQWILQNREIRLALETAAKKQQLDPREHSYQLPAEVENALDVNQELLWNFYADYIHMTNNRLGILNKDEGYLGFLIMQSLLAIQKDQFRISKSNDLENANFEKIILDTLF